MFRDEMRAYRLSDPTLSREAVCHLARRSFEDACGEDLVGVEAHFLEDRCNTDDRFWRGGTDLGLPRY